jgi:hypothetical protein
MGVDVIEWPNKYFYLKLVIVSVLVILICNLWVSFTNAYVPFPLYVAIWVFSWIAVPVVTEVE